MKKSLKGKGFIIVVFLVIVCLLILDMFLSKKHVPTDIQSSKDEGTKAFYLSLSEYGKMKGFKTEIFSKYARFIPDGSLVICLQPTMEILEDYELKYIKEQIYKGSTYMLFADSFLYKDFLSEFEGLKQTGENENWSIYKYNQGKILVSDTLFTNKNIKKNKSDAVEVLLKIGEMGYKRVYVDEFYHYENDSTEDIFGSNVYYFIGEAILAVILLMLSLAGRFGASEKVVANDKRVENENVYALAGLYQRSDPGVSFKIHTESILEDVERYLGYGNANRIAKQDLIKEALSNKKLCSMGLDKVLHLYLELDSVRLNRSKARKYIDLIDEIRKELLFYVS